MRKSFKTALVLAPHTDDGEIGCGGTISKLIEDGTEVYYIAFSSARESLRQRGLDENVLVSEVNVATSVLGIKKENLILFDYKVRHFPAFRQEILEDLIKLKNKIKPDLILTPSLNDIHQDHKIISEESLRAFKNITILGYEEPWNNIEFQTRAFFYLEKKHIEKKIRALKCYQSQMHRDYLDEEFVFSLAKTRGVQIQSKKYCEAFEIIRLVLE